MGAKSDDRQAKTLILKNGSKHKIIGSNDRYWLCEKTQFRKSNPEIAEIIMAKPKKKKEEQEEQQEEEGDKE